MGRGGGGVTKASETSVRLSFTYQNERCRPTIKLKPTASNIKKAERFLDEVKAAINNGTFDYAVSFPNCPKRFKFARIKGQVLSIEQALTEWLEEARGRLKNSTYINYKKIVNNRLIPSFGHYAMSDLERSDVTLWASAMNVSAKTLSNILSPLMQLYNDAHNNGVIDFNPLANWKYTNKKSRNKKSDISPFTAKEQAAILAALEGQNKNLIQFAFWTGLRTSELTALDWSDINLVEGYVNVNKAFTQASNEIEGTKTAAGERKVKLLPQAISALKSQKKYTFLKGEEVFQNPRHKQRWTGDQPIRKTLWIPALKKAKVDYRRPYQTRHTYASMMLTAGESLAWLSSQLGHATVLITAKVYAKYIEGSHPDAGMKADLLFNSENKA